MGNQFVYTGFGLGYHWRMGGVRVSFQKVWGVWEVWGDGEQRRTDDFFDT